MFCWWLLNIIHFVVLYQPAADCATDHSPGAGGASGARRPSGDGPQAAAGSEYMIFINDVFTCSLVLDDALLNVNADVAERLHST